MKTLEMSHFILAWNKTKKNPKPQIHLRIVILWNVILLKL